MDQHHNSTSAMIIFSPTYSSSPVIIIISPAPSSSLELMTILSQLSPYLIDGELHEADTIETSADHSEARRPASSTTLVASSEHESSRSVSEIVQTDPVNIPLVPMQKSRDECEDKFVPPHLITARRCSSPFSVLQGAGRTLKGRDLIQFRNDVWRKTGSLQV